MGLKFAGSDPADPTITYDIDSSGQNLAAGRPDDLKSGLLACILTATAMLNGADGDYYHQLLKVASKRLEDDEQRPSDRSCPEIHR